MSKMMEAMAGTSLWSWLPSSRLTGRPSALPLRSQSAMSTALKANAAMPSGPYHQVRPVIVRQCASTSSGSAPVSSGA